MNIAPEVYTRILAAKRYMDEHFQQPIGLACVSRQACLSPFHFHRLFTRIYHRTPHRYLTQKRISRALQLLKDGDQTVSEICGQVGFESIGSFSGLFKRETGIGPLSYRREAFRRKLEIRNNPQKFIPACFGSPC
jgi:AraC-like DNA-binding protein